ncbi:hypothetical protein HHI36_013154, partial [Cryptolaemus montrouzieri]
YQIQLAEEQIISKSWTPLEIEQSESTICTWTSNETKILLDLYGKYRHKVGTSAIRNLKKLLKTIAEELNSVLNTLGPDC